MKFRPASKLRTAIVAGAALAALALPAAANAQAFDDGRSAWTGFGTKTYEVKIDNLTTGQPLSPPLVSTHYGRGVIFTEGRYASFGVWNVAEWGGADVLAQEQLVYRHFGWVHEYKRADQPLVPKGRTGAANFKDTVTIRITSKGWADRISFASMLGCTNDGFTGIDSLKLPQRSGQSTTVNTFAYDAGTERNTESYADLGAGCQAAIGDRSTTGQAGTTGGRSNGDILDLKKIARHPGVQGSATDGLKRNIHGWGSGPVARVTITNVTDRTADPATPGRPGAVR